MWVKGSLHFVTPSINASDTRQFARAPRKNPHFRLPTKNSKGVLGYVASYFARCILAAVEVPLGLDKVVHMVHMVAASPAKRSSALLGLP